MVQLEDNCRKMAQVIKDKKKKRQEYKEEEAKKLSAPVTLKDLESLEVNLSSAEQGKLIEEKKLKE